jgi:hypothetical protein
LKITNVQYNSYKVTTSGTYVFDNASQRTIIGKNGIASVWSNNEYFHVEKKQGQTLKISMKGDMYIDGKFKNLPLTNNVNSGELYLNGNNLCIKT